jgi:hypothetical protein
MKTVSIEFSSTLCRRNATRLVAPQSSSVWGLASTSGEPSAIHVWNRPPEQNASPLPTTVTRIVRTSMFADAANRHDHAHEQRAW